MPVLLASALLSAGIKAPVPSTAYPSIGLVGPYVLEPCTIDVSKAPTPGLDISDNFANFPNPFAFYTSPDHPGVTLPGPDRQAKCNWTIGTPSGVEVPFVWNAKDEQCILNGVYTSNYDPKPEVCVTGETNVMSLEDREIWSASVGKSVMVSGIPGESEAVEVVIGVGHGPLDVPCGGVALVQNVSLVDGESVTAYAAVSRIGTRAWSYEISEAAAIHLARDNRGGTCYIPNVDMMTDEDIQNILKQL